MMTQIQQIDQLTMQSNAEPIALQSVSLKQSVLMSQHQSSHMLAEDGDHGFDV